MLYTNYLVSLSMSENTAIQISRKRLNGIKLRAAEDNRKIHSEMLDVILKKSGVPELTDEELDSKLRELEVAAE